MLWLLVAVIFLYFAKCDAVQSNFHNRLHRLAMPHPVIDAAERVRRDILNREAATTRRLTDAYGRAYQRMQTQIAALEEQLATAGELSRAKAANLATLRSLRNQVIDEVGRFAVFAEQEISLGAATAIERGLEDALALSQAYFTTQPSLDALSAAWRVLPADQVETMIGFLGPDSPLHTSFVSQLGESVAARMEDALLDGIALGRGPRQIAAIVRRELGQGLTWSLNTVRTAQVWSYREATRASFIANSDIVDGWTWYAQLDNRVCMSCVAKHGSKHPVDEVLNDHHSGRCVALPNLPLAKSLGIKQPEIQPGEVWFTGLPQAQQRGLMGPAKFAAWRDGAFAFNQLSQPYDDPVYGDMLREASLIGILGDAARQYYI